MDLLHLYQNIEGIREIRNLETHTPYSLSYQRHQRYIYQSNDYAQVYTLMILQFHLAIASLPWKHCRAFFDVSGGVMEDIS